MALLPYSTNNSWLIFWRCHPELAHGAPFCIGSTVRSRKLPISLQLFGIHPAHGVFYDGSYLLVFPNRPITFMGAFANADVVVHSFIFRVQHDDHANVPIQPGCSFFIMPQCHNHAAYYRLVPPIDQPQSLFAHEQYRSAQTLRKPHPPNLVIISHNWSATANESTILKLQPWCHVLTTFAQYFRFHLWHGSAIYGDLPMLQQQVCHTVALPFTLKSILRQMKNYENSNISPCENIIFKKSSKRNPSRYYNFMTNLNFQHKPKYHFSNYYKMWV